MSLVTRCPACATTFKVVRDQLRISEGWVRCGRCSEVFDATQALQDIESGEALSVQAFATPKPPAPQASPPAAATSPSDPFGALQTGLDSFGQQQKAAGTADSAASEASVNSDPPASAASAAWPTSGSLDLRAQVAPAEPNAPSAPAAPHPPSALFSLKQPTRDASPAAEPAWRRIQITPEPQQAPAPPPLGLMADEPWPMRAASAAAEPAAPATSAVDAAVDAQLQKALRRARVQALREERKQRALQKKELAWAAPAPQEAAASSQTSLQQVPAGAQSPAGKVLMRGPTSEPVEPSADTLLDSTLYSAEFMESGPAPFEQRKPARGKPWLWALLALLAASVLALQWMHHERNALAASHSALRPVVESLCRIAACTLSAPRRIEAVRIDGSSFTPAREPGQFELLFTLRNATATAVAMPSIELSLLDGNERPVTRRVFHPADFGAPTQLAPRAERSAELRLLLQVPPDQRASPVVGYSMLAFYP